MNPDTRLTRRVPTSDFLTGPCVASCNVRPHRIVLAVFTVVLALGAVTAPVAAQESACGTVLDDASNASAGPGGQLADAIGDQGSEIGSELNDRWFDARLANATSDAARAEIIANEVERVEARLDLTERCVRGRESGNEGESGASELTRQQVDALERQALSLHRRINETRSHAAALPQTLRERHDIGSDRFTTLERRVVALRESLSELYTATRTANGDKEP